MISASSSSSTADAPRNHKCTATWPNQNNATPDTLVVPAPSVRSPSPSSSASVSSHRPSSFSSCSDGGGGGSSQACAVCKFQRRRCRPDCLLAPFFPAKDAAKFQNAHRLFGVSNIQKLVRPLEPCQRAIAMETIIYESNMRAADPVSGCLGVVQQLQCQLRHDFAELGFVLDQLNACHAAAASSQQQRAVPDPIALQAAGVDIADHDELNGNFAPWPMIHHPQQADRDQFSNYLCYDDKEQSVLLTNSSIINAANSNDGAINEQQKYLSLQSFQNQQGQGVVQGDAIVDKPATLIAADDDSELALVVDGGRMFRSRRCSLQVDEVKEVQNPVASVQEQDLKGAAFLFTLTNYNT